jgi:hypothetical protein
MTHIGKYFVKTEIMTIEEKVKQLSVQVSNMITRQRSITEQSKLTRVREMLLMVFDADPDCIVSASDLILEQEVDTEKSNYRFDVSGMGEKLETEKRLDLRDAFVVSSIGYFLVTQAGDTDTSSVAHTFPDTRYMTDGMADAAEVLYNSFLNLTVNNMYVMSSYHTGVFRKELFSDDRVYPLYDGLRDIDPYIVLSGTKNNYFRLDLPGRVMYTGWRHRIRIQLHGHLIRGLYNEEESE